MGGAEGGPWGRCDTVFSVSWWAAEPHVRQETAGSIATTAASWEVYGKRRTELREPLDVQAEEAEESHPMGGEGSLEWHAPALTNAFHTSENWVLTGFLL